MEQNIENNDWKKEAPFLAGLPVRNAFSVPEGYFEGLSVQISGAVYLESLKDVEHAGFTLPENYFEGLGESIHAKLIAERLKEEIPNEGLIVPVNYFDDLQASILAKTTGAPQPKIVRLWHSKLLKYASAACFLIMASAGLYFNYQSPAQPVNYAELAAEQMLFDIDEDVIIDHIEANGMQEQKVANTKDAALESYILSNYSQSDLTTDY
ncbi:hypothetical protein [Pedobacter metabolipauper]|uniref:Uncharacterized protein n=1 Tax=Pedobacter metabolipauper TaxID=425513 RepID=A0A4R6SS98_9SPHI|nr:hypothetical protein [Pedobacter metabolipauper]TDQ07408.1 hypothetical protein ATK78_3529 [Pedobacter metabolipauper]